LTNRAISAAASELLTVNECKSRPWAACQPARLMKLPSVNALLPFCTTL
jgi:hypothetical protein